MTTSRHLDTMPLHNTTTKDALFLKLRNYLWTRSHVILMDVSTATALPKMWEFRIFASVWRKERLVVSVFNWLMFGVGFFLCVFFHTDMQNKDLLA